MDSRREEGRAENKLKDGPCAQQFEWLEICAQKNGVVNEKQKMKACPSETDRLIKCVNKHPVFFQTS
jgi:hypothetical protein